jgi:hypothetical protein
MVCPQEHAVVETRPHAKGWLLQPHLYVRAVTALHLLHDTPRVARSQARIHTLAQPELEYAHYLYIQRRRSLHRPELR